MHRFFLTCLFVMALCACEVSSVQTQTTIVPTKTPTRAELAQDTPTVLPTPTATHTLVPVTATIRAVPTNTETSQAAIANYLAVQKNPDLNDEEKIKITIDTYFTLRYEGQKVVAAQDFSLLVEDNTLDWVKKEMDKREIELYIA